MSMCEVCNKSSKLYLIFPIFKSKGKIKSFNSYHFTKTIGPRTKNKVICWECTQKIRKYYPEHKQYVDQSMNVNEKYLDDIYINVFKKIFLVESI